MLNDIDVRYIVLRFLGGKFSTVALSCSFVVWLFIRLVVVQYNAFTKTRTNQIPFRL